MQLTVARSSDVHEILKTLQTLMVGHVSLMEVTEVGL
jgi:hypothetical protein